MEATDIESIIVCLSAHALCSIAWIMRVCSPLSCLQQQRIVTHLLEVEVAKEAHSCFCPIQVPRQINTLFVHPANCSQGPPGPPCMRTLDCSLSRLRWNCAAESLSAIKRGDDINNRIQYRCPEAFGPLWRPALNSIWVINCVLKRHFQCQRQSLEPVSYLHIIC